MIPQVLNDAAQYIASLSLTLKGQGTRSRAFSGVAQAQIIEELHKARQWTIETPGERAWHDVKIDGHYCDVKISAFEMPDNTNASRAIYYLLTGDNSPPRADKNFFCKMRENESESDARDYYYFVVNKTDTRDVFVVSLKGIQAHTNAANRPFQCRWDNCRTPIIRTWQEAREYLLAEWAKSIRREIKKLQTRQESYPELFA